MCGNGLKYLSAPIETGWVLAKPDTTTYEGISRKKVIKKYTKMSNKSFDKQFKASSKPTTYEEEILIDSKDPTEQITIKRTNILQSIEKWNKDIINGRLISIIYTHPDDYPIGEAVYVENMWVSKKDINIIDDLNNFYKRFNWNTDIELTNPKHPYDIEILDEWDTILPYLFID